MNDVAMNAPPLESATAPSLAGPDAHDAVAARAPTARPSSASMSRRLRVAVLGIGAWTAGHPGWPALAAALGDAPHEAIEAGAARRPSPALLPAAERRRAPDGVAVALEVAREAVAMTGDRVDATRLASVFASAYGDLAIVDYLCDTLANDAALLSPTRFHLSVHNAAAGYWSIATHDRSPTNAIAAGDDSFAMGLLEAATVATAERRPVLSVAFDTAAVGLVAHVAPNRALFGFALVVAPLLADADASAPMPSEATLSMTVASSASAAPLPLPRRRALQALAGSSAAARSLALAEAIARHVPAVLSYPIGNGTILSIAVEPPDRNARSIG